MPTEEQMTVNERRKYLKLMKPRYQQAKRAARSRLRSRHARGDGIASQECAALVTCKRTSLLIMRPSLAWTTNWTEESLCNRIVPHSYSTLATS